MPVYDKRYEDQPNPNQPSSGEYVNIVLKVISPYGEDGVRMSPPRFGRLELGHEQLGFLPVYNDYKEAMKDYPHEQIYQVRLPANG